MKNLLTKSIQLGVLTGVLASIYTIILYMLGLEYYGSWWMSMIAFVLIIVLIFYFAIKIKRQSLVEFFGFKEGFVTILSIGVTASLVITLWNVLLFNVIHTELAQNLTDHIIEKTSEMMEKFGAPESAMEETLAEMANMTEQFGVAGLMLGWVKSLIFYVILGIIGGLIIKQKTKEPSQTIDLA